MIAATLLEEVCRIRSFLFHSLSDLDQSTARREISYRRLLIPRNDNTQGFHTHCDFYLQGSDSAFFEI